MMKTSTNSDSLFIFQIFQLSGRRPLPNRVVIIGVTASVFLWFAAHGQAQWYVGPVEGDWHTTENWSPAGIPTGSSDVLLNRDSVRISSPATVNTVSVAYYGSNTLTLDSTLTAQMLSVGRISGEGTLNINTGGSLVIGTDFRIGDFSGGIGTVNMSGGSVTVTNKIFLGMDPGGVGTLNLSGGTFSARGLYFNEWGGNGALMISGGTITTDWLSFNSANGGGLIQFTPDSPGKLVIKDTLGSASAWLTNVNGWINSGFIVDGKAAVVGNSVELTALPAVDVRQVSLNTWRISNSRIEVDVRTFSFPSPTGGFISVRDKLSGHRWVQPGAMSRPAFSNLQIITNGVEFTVPWPDPVAGSFPLRVRLTVPSRTSPQLVMRYGTTATNTQFTALEPFEPFQALTTAGSRLMMTDWCSGHLYPTDLGDAEWPNIFITDYDVSLMQLPLVGIVDIYSGLGYSITIDTPDDVNLRCIRLNGGRVPVVRWLPVSKQTVNGVERGTWGYDRQVTLTFTADGGYVDLLGTFRNSLPDSVVQTFRQKEASNPNIRRLYGAPLIWDYFSKIDPVEANTLGVRKARHFVHTWGHPLNADRIVENELPRLQKAHELGWLTYEYTTFGDAYLVNDASQIDWVNETADNFLLNANGQRVPGWSDIFGQQYKRSPALYANRSRQRLSSRQSLYPITGYYVDVHPTRALEEDFNPKFPRSRSGYRSEVMSLLEGFKEGFNSGPLATAGEGGKWWQVGVLDSPLGLMSYLRYPWNVYSPTHYGQTSYSNGENYDSSLWATYETYGSLGHRFRAPLWELVFSDCVTSDWYPTDSVDWHARTSGLPFSYQKKKDALTVLYGAVPTFFQVGEADSEAGNGWFLDRRAWLASYRNACIPHERLAVEKMVSHRFLPGRNEAVQETRWSDGTVITANFENEDYWVTNRHGELYLLRKFDFLVDGPDFTVSRSQIIALGRSVTKIRTNDYIFSDVQEHEGEPVALTTMRHGERTLRIIAEDNGTAKAFYVFPETLLPGWNRHRTIAWVCDPTTGRRLRRITPWLQENSCGFSGLTGWTVIELTDGLTAFEFWAENVEWEEADDSVMGDPDGDGVVNFLEYAFGLNPLAPDASASTPEVRIEPGIDAIWVAVSFRERIEADDVTVVVETSSSLNLGSWTERMHDGSEVIREILDPNIDGEGLVRLVRYRIRLPQGETRCFVRLRATGQ